MLEILISFLNLNNNNNNPKTLNPDIPSLPPTSNEQEPARLCVCVCVCLCVRACVPACVHA